MTIRIDEQKEIRYPVENAQPGYKDIDVSVERGEDITEIVETLDMHSAEISDAAADAGIDQGDSGLIEVNGCKLYVSSFGENDQQIVYLAGHPEELFSDYKEKIENLL